MSISKLLIFSIFFSLFFLKIRASSLIEDDSYPSDSDSSLEDEILSSDGSDSSLRLELEQLKSRISDLGSGIKDSTRELESKDESIAKMEKIIQEKSYSIASLQGEIESLERKGSVDAQEKVGRAHARAAELEKQVQKLQNEIETQNKRREALEVRTGEIEKKRQELNLKLDKLQKINDEQKNRIRKTEHALQVAEEEMVKAKLEATLKAKEFMEIQGAWLPPWLATHLIHMQFFAEKEWNEHGKPALAIVMQKRWVPVLKEQWLAFTTFVGPHVESVTIKTVEVYEASKSTLTPHIVKVQELANPYLQEARKFSKPYIDHIATITKPHVDKVRVTLKPYTNQVVSASQKFLKSAKVYHYQVQATVQDTLKKHELTEPLATTELVWFMASALLALPIVFLYRVLSAIFCKKPGKPTQNAHVNHAPRRHKRRHADK
ncbi:uncharacterized protein LOC131256625 isoform X2 [Magnolia sinica]|uniref:uncharacterized protein LOC131256625 isoform X2 n=1 Tax=Magnolia sinica TaxID=86752 RepID=UPI0026580678|nr:uncharacterized protein LOC131256625 isoform X2 [Magnolia sinica]